MKTPAVADDEKMLRLGVTHDIHVLFDKRWDQARRYRPLFPDIFRSPQPFRPSSDVTENGGRNHQRVFSETVSAHLRTSCPSLLSPSDVQHQSLPPSYQDSNSHAIARLLTRVLICAASLAVRAVNPTTLATVAPFQPYKIDSKMPFPAARGFMFCYPMAGPGTEKQYGRRSLPS